MADGANNTDDLEHADRLGLALNGFDRAHGGYDLKDLKGMFKKATLSGYNREQVENHTQTIKGK